MHRVVPVAALATALLLVSTGHAWAYLDPGMGSMLLQGLIAGIAAVSVVGGRYWYKIKSLISGKRPPPPESTPDTGER